MILHGKRPAAPEYYVNSHAEADGSHAVHKDDPHCPVPAPKAHRLYLGDFETSAEAVKEAKRLFKTANACASCCGEPDASTTGT